MSLPSQRTCSGRPQPTCETPFRREAGSPPPHTTRLYCRARCSRYLNKYIQFNEPAKKWRADFHNTNTRLPMTPEKYFSVTMNFGKQFSLLLLVVLTSVSEVAPASPSAAVFLTRAVRLAVVAWTHGHLTPVSTPVLRAGAPLSRGITHPAPRAVQRATAHSEKRRKECTQAVQGRNTE